MAPYLASRGHQQQRSLLCRLNWSSRWRVSTSDVSLLENNRNPKHISLKLIQQHHWNGNIVILMKLFITGCTGSCQNENFQCSQWWKFRQIGAIFVSVTVLNNNNGNTLQPPTTSTKLVSYGGPQIFFQRSIFVTFSSLVIKAFIFLDEFYEPQFLLPGEFNARVPDFLRVAFLAALVLRCQRLNCARSWKRRLMWWFGRQKYVSQARISNCIPQNRMQVLIPARDTSNSSCMNMNIKSVAGRWLLDDASKVIKSTTSMR